MRSAKSRLTRSELVVAVTVVVAAMVGTSPAAADPEDLVPVCSAGEVPELNNCRAGPNQEFATNAPGANPELPVGIDPGLATAT
jgi:hypothetical protein